MLAGLALEKPSSPLPNDFIFLILWCCSSAPVKPFNQIWKYLKYEIKKKLNTKFILQAIVKNH